MHFVTQLEPDSRSNRPKDAVLLLNDGWDDYSHKVRFNAIYFDDQGKQASIGKVKILQRKEGGTVRLKPELQHKSENIGDDAISLGQGDSYYRHVGEIFEGRAGKFLEAMRDISWQPQLAEPFEPTSAYRNALMRENSAYRGLRFGRAIVLQEPLNERFDFSYQASIKGADADVEIDFPFNDDDELPGRIVALVGRNAVGKTRVLAQLAQDLVQIDRASDNRIRERERRFGKERPLFTRVLAISYSAFDKFARPSSEATSYVYCGIRNERGSLSKQHLEDIFSRNYARVVESSRSADWSQHIDTILGGAPNPFQKIEEAGEGNLVDEISARLALLSSGQAILTHFVTALLAWIQPSSLVLFDEPETHLHPNAVATLFAVLTRILERHESYAVLATHSPIVIQEVPAKRVVVLRREGNVTAAEPLGLESFGESISELTSHVFETHSAEAQYRRVLKRLAQIEEAPNVLERFPLGLSMSAQAYLIGQYAAKMGKKQ